MLLSCSSPYCSNVSDISFLHQLSSTNVLLSPGFRPYSRSFTCCPLWRTTAASAPSLSLQTPAAAPQTTRPITARPSPAACQQEQKTPLNSASSPGVLLSHLPPRAWRRRRGRRKTTRRRRKRRKIRVLVPQRKNTERMVSLPTSQSGQCGDVIQGRHKITG